MKLMIMIAPPDGSHRAGELTKATLVFTKVYSFHTLRALKDNLAPYLEFEHDMLEMGFPMSDYRKGTAFMLISSLIGQEREKLMSTIIEFLFEWVHKYERVGSNPIAMNIVPWNTLSTIDAVYATISAELIEESPDPDRASRLLN